ncbi:chemotaxis protein CheW, partial [Magnetococcales bacterium HHB-1]
MIETPKQITKVPKSHPAIVGAINFRERLVTAIDLSVGLSLTPIDFENELSYIIICEYSGTVQGLVISYPNKLINKSWEEVRTPSSGIQNSGYLTAITYENDDSIQILDVEKILGEIVGVDESLSDELLEEGRRLN